MLEGIDEARQAAGGPGGDAELLPGSVGVRLADLARRLGAVRSGAARIVAAEGATDLRTLRQRTGEFADLLAEASGLAREVARALEPLQIPAAGPAVDRYAADLEAEFARLNLPVQGAFPQYEIFPMSVRIDLPNEAVIVGRRRLASLRPRAVAQAIRKEYDRLHRSAFNADRFLTALFTCHQKLLSAAPVARGEEVRLGDVLLSDVYALLSARTGSAGYTKAEFCFDIYRLRRQSAMEIDGKHGRYRIEFHHGKRGGAAFVVPRAQGSADRFSAMTLVPVLAGV